jgi:hypothetical protein
MAITISGTDLTFNNGTVQSTEATLLSAVQYTSYFGTNVFSNRGYTTSVIDDWQWGTTYLGQSGPASSTSVVCGFQAYRSGFVNVGNDGDPNDGAVIQRRMVYRSVSGA